MPDCQCAVPFVFFLNDPVDTMNTKHLKKNAQNELTSHNDNGHSDFSHYDLEVLLRRGKETCIKKKRKTSHNKN